MALDKISWPEEKINSQRAKASQLNHWRRCPGLASNGEVQARRHLVLGELFCCTLEIDEQMLKKIFGLIPVSRSRVEPNLAKVFSVNKKISKIIDNKGGDNKKKVDFL